METSLMKYLLLILSCGVIQGQVLIDHYRFTTPGDDNNLLTGLIGHWSLDESSGQALDSSSEARHLALDGTIGANITGKIDGSRVFNGGVNADLFTTNTATWAELGTTNFTISFWFKPTGSFLNDQIIVCKGDYGGGLDWQIFVTSSATYTTYPDGHELVFAANGFGPTWVKVPISGNGVALQEDWYFGYVRRETDNFEIGIVYPNAGIITTFNIADLAALKGAPGVSLTHFSDLFSIGGAIFSGVGYEPSEWKGELDDVHFTLRTLSDCELYKLIRSTRFSIFDTDACN
jgi:hypothetical protein